MCTSLRSVAAFVLVVAFGSVGFADPIVNSRSGAVDVLPGPEVPLQGVFNNLFGAGNAPNVATDQSSIGSFRPTFETVFTYLAGYAGFRPSNVFGIFEVNNIASAERVVFPGGTLNGTEVAGAFSNSAQQHDFGFFVDVFANSEFRQYRLTSDDSRNPGGMAQMLIFVGNGQAFLNPSFGIDGRFNSNDILIAIEDMNRSVGSDHDFNDLVILLENVQMGQPAPDPTFQISLPEPASLAVWSLIGIAGSAFAWRRSRVRK
jgi:hypothetical protein